MKNVKLMRLVASALLISIGILIPMFSPLKFILEPASFTLGSHVVIFIAMFISPTVAISVAIGISVGFFFGPYPPVVVLRALSHVIFAYIGSFVLKTNISILSNRYKTFVFSLVIGFIHALCEVIVVSFFYFGNGLPIAYSDKGFLSSVMLLIGLGTVIHSMIDFEIALVIWRRISKSALIVK